VGGWGGGGGRWGGWGGGWGGGARFQMPAMTSSRRVGRTVPQGAAKCRLQLRRALFHAAFPLSSHGQRLTCVHSASPFLPRPQVELQEIVDFFRKPDKFRASGSRIPKGVLLCGPPGTGKTLLARCAGRLRAGAGGGEGCLGAGNTAHDLHEALQRWRDGAQQAGWRPAGCPVPRRAKGCCPVASIPGAAAPHPSLAVAAPAPPACSPLTLTLLSQLRLQGGGGRGWGHLHRPQRLRVCGDVCGRGRLPRARPLCTGKLDECLATVAAQHAQQSSPGCPQLACVTCMLHSCQVQNCCRLPLLLFPPHRRGPRLPPSSSSMRSTPWAAFGEPSWCPPTRCVAGAPLASLQPARGASFKPSADSLPPVLIPPLSCLPLPAAAPWATTSATRRSTRCCLRWMASTPTCR
jgi:hypothetical protein